MLMIMNTLLVAGVLVFVVKKQASPVAVSAGATAAAAEGEHGEKAGEHGEEKSEHGEEKGHKGEKEGPSPMLKLESFVIQLKGGESERYVRVAFDLELKSEAGKEAVTNRMSQVRDSVIAFFSDRTLDELRGSDGMDHVKLTLLKRLDSVVPGHHIKAIYITDFIIQ